MAASIEVEHVQDRLPSGVAVLDDVSFTVEPGDVLVLVGRSGVGKTTILRLINHLLLPSTGEIRVEGRATAAWDPIALRPGSGTLSAHDGRPQHCGRPSSGRMAGGPHSRTLQRTSGARRTRSHQLRKTVPPRTLRRTAPACW